MFRYLTLSIALAGSIAYATPPFPKEAEILKDVKVADGFEAALFSAPPQSNYAVFVSAAPDGTLYVSSDGNGSLDRQLDRGRILRLRDTDGDGRADEVKEFAKVNSPRGLVIDGNTLFVMHPPDLTAYVDKDGDGVADESKVIVKGLAFDLKNRPADHTTNGLTLGIDGWLYVACGDFGFMEATGTDGRKLQLRGGGIVRVRPDGSDIQLYSRGTRNILEAAVSPLCDLFSRDNTNDGGGWDIRFHHFTGFEDHGYPRLFKNFTDELIQPLADYGGGSGCGACWIDEPGWPAGWNNLPYTCDWGRGPVFRHTVREKGATFEETEKPKALVGMTRATDIDVDARGYAYVASWRGPATFGWAGPDHGYIVRVAPKGLVPAAVPDFAKATDGELVKLLASRSHRTRLEAQRTLLRRAPDVEMLYTRSPENEPESLEFKVARLYLVAQIKPDVFARPAFAPDSAYFRNFIRCVGDLPANEYMVHLARDLVRSHDARTRNEAIITLGRLHGLTGVWSDGGTPTPQHLKTGDLAESIAAIAPLLADADPVVAHTAMQVLRQFGASEACFAILDNANASTPLRNGAFMVLRGIHDAKTVDGLIARLRGGTGFQPVGPAGVPPAAPGTAGKIPAGPTAGTAVPQTAASSLREGILTALCRLHFIEGKWKGDSWGTRPDTRGPYYQPEEWSETPKILAVLKTVLAEAGSDEAAFLGKELFRHRIKLDDATTKLVSLAGKDASLIPIVAKQLAETDSIPGNALPLLVKAASDATSKEDVLVPAVRALSKTDGTESVQAILTALGHLGGDGRNQARDAFFHSRLIENQHQLLETIAEKADGKESMWADAALLRISGRKVGAPEPREMAGKALDSGWAQPKRRAQIIRAAIETDDKSRGAQIAAAVSDPDKDVAKLATEAVKRLKLERPKSAPTNAPQIGTLKVDDVLAEVLKTKGDASRGEQLFTQIGCIACHTVKESEPPKGPFLGNIATTYKRRELAEAILIPSKTIAQGFVTNVFTMKDGSVQLGFVTQEAADRIVIRTITAQEITIDPKQIAKRDKNDQSLMPPGLFNAMTVHDLASVLDWLEGLAKK